MELGLNRSEWKVIMHCKRKISNLKVKKELNFLPPRSTSSGLASQITRGWRTSVFERKRILFNEVNLDFKIEFLSVMDKSAGTTFILEEEGHTIYRDYPI